MGEMGCGGGTNTATIRLENRVNLCTMQQSIRVGGRSGSGRNLPGEMASGEWIDTRMIRFGIRVNLLSYSSRIKPRDHGIETKR